MNGSKEGWVGLGLCLTAHSRHRFRSRDPIWVKGLLEWLNHIESMWDLFFVSNEIVLRPNIDLIIKPQKHNLTCLEGSRTFS